MTIVADSSMGIIFPENILHRIGEFIEGKQNFPFVGPNELMCIFFLYGKNSKVNTENEYKDALDLAERTFAKVSKDISAYSGNLRVNTISQFARSNYINRGLQIAVEKKSGDASLRDRIFSDPTILLDCFARHVAYYNQEFFFEIYGPFKNSDITRDTERYLLGRMVMIGYNRKDHRSLPFDHPLIPLYVRMRQSSI